MRILVWQIQTAHQFDKPFLILALEFLWELVVHVRVTPILAFRHSRAGGPWNGALGLQP